MCSTCKSRFAETVEAPGEVLAQRAVLTGIGKAFVDIPLAGHPGETLRTGAGETPHQIVAGATIVARRRLALVNVCLAQSSGVPWPAAAGVRLQGVVGNKDHRDTFYCLHVGPDTETPLAAASILAWVTHAGIMVHRVYLHPALPV